MFRDSSYMLHDLRGFTLIELLVAIAVLAILSVSLFIGYRSVSGNFEVKTSAFKILDALNLARTRTVSSLGASSYGVYFEPTQFTLFKGTSYVLGDPNNIMYLLPATAEIANIALAGGGVAVIFDRITGKTAQTGTLQVRLISTPSKLRTIEVLASGRSDITESELNPSGTTRKTDSRHVHFTYGQGIAATVSLVLNFPNDAVIQNIPFPAYYTGGAFDWSGTITVAGSPQVLRVHTHATTAGSADFSVTRDLRYNNKALQISLDTQNIVNYSAVGVVTQGSSAWASAPIAQ